MALHAIVDEGAFKLAAILPFETAPSMLLPITVLTIVDGTVRPVLLALAVMLIVNPVSLIIGSVHVVIGTLAI